MHKFIGRELFTRRASYGNRVLVRKLHLIHEVHFKWTEVKFEQLPIKKIRDIQLAPCKVVENQNDKHYALVTLSQLLPMIQPRQYLKVDLPEGSEEVDLDNTADLRFEIGELPPDPKDATDRKKKYKRLGTSKEIHLTTDLHPVAFRHRLSLAYFHVAQDDRVEFHLRPRVKSKTLTVDWALKNLPYLRPDVILKSMPEGTGLFIPPIVIDSKSSEELVWAFSKKPEDFSEEFADERSAAHEADKQWTEGSERWQKAVKESRRRNALKPELKQMLVRQLISNISLNENLGSDSDLPSTQESMLRYIESHDELDEHAKSESDKSSPSSMDIHGTDLDIPMVRYYELNDGLKERPKSDPDKGPPSSIDMHGTDNDKPIVRYHGSNDGLNERPKSEPDKGPPSSNDIHGTDNDKPIVRHHGLNAKSDHTDNRAFLVRYCRSDVALDKPAKSKSDNGLPSSINIHGTDNHEPVVRYHGSDTPFESAKSVPEKKTRKVQIRYF
ncbi:MAG: hypothetical protein Q9191_003454 [Dirinaria sp. TL-2023a]